MTNKLQKAFCTALSLLLFFSTVPADDVYSQDTGYSKPPVTEKYHQYRKQVKQNGEKKIVELKGFIPGIMYDLRYASTNNFMQRLMYHASTKNTFLRLPATEALKKVQDELNQLGFGVKIFDAYRPYAVTVMFWELVKNEDYVAHPRNGSGHNRGVAVDLTLIDLKTGKELEMGTDFDNFSDTAHHGFTNLSADVLLNRQRLKSIMEKYGFRAYEKEWGHYSLPDAAKFELMDISFKKLKKSL